MTDMMFLLFLVVIFMKIVAALMKELVSIYKKKVELETQFFLLLQLLMKKVTRFYMKIVGMNDL